METNNKKVADDFHLYFPFFNNTNIKIHFVIEMFAKSFKTCSYTYFKIYLFAEKLLIRKFLMVRSF